MRGFCSVPSSLVGTDDRTSRFVENRVRASFRAVSGAPGFTVFDYGVWCTVRVFVFHFVRTRSSGLLLPHPYEVFGDERIEF